MGTGNKKVYVINLIDFTVFRIWNGNGKVGNGNEMGLQRFNRNSGVQWIFSNNCFGQEIQNFGTLQKPIKMPLHGVTILII